MTMRSRKPRVYITYPVTPTRRFGLHVDDAFESESPADAAIWGTAIANTIQSRLQGERECPEAALIVELTTPTPERYRGLLERAISEAIRRVVGGRFASVVCQVRG